MKVLFLFLYITALVYFVCGVFGNERIPQVKVVGAQITSLNPEYHTNLVTTIHRKNATFNNINLFWDLKKDIPADAVISLKVYITDPTYQKGTLALDASVPLCKPSEYRELLPTVFRVPESDFYTACIKKGTYAVKDLELFRFSILIPDLESRGHYYRTDYKISSNDTVLGTATYYSEWGYLHTD